MEVVVYLHCGCPTAGTDALNLFERERAVARDFLVIDAKLLSAMVEHFFGAAQHATDVGADLHDVLAGRLGSQQGVITDDVANLELRQLDSLGDFANHIISEVPDFILRIKKKRNQGRPFPGILTDKLLQPLFQFGRELHYLSISPRTISILPIAATTSASNLPTQRLSSACKLPKHAERMWTRYGFAVPSLRT